MSAVEASDLPALRGFVRGLRKDLPAVLAGLSLPHSNGPAEVVNTKVKLLKRHMYGRAGFALLRRRISGVFDQAEVDLDDGAVAELLGEAGGGLAAAGEEDDAGDGAVEAVRDAEVDVAGLVVLLLEVGAGLGLEGGDAGGDALGEQAGGLGEGEAVVVFKQDGERLSHGANAKPPGEATQPSFPRSAWERTAQPLCGKD